VDEDKPKPDRRRRISTGVDLVALVLALGLVITMILVVTGTTFNRATNDKLSPLGDNTTQIFIAGIGGMVALLGTYIGYRVGNSRNGNGNGNGKSKPDEKPPPDRVE
jgi:hypothetical protein